MLKTLREVLRVKNATTSYPDKPVRRPPGARGKPVHSSQQCICCAACANACPSNAIQMRLDLEKGTETWLFNVGRCIFCGRCEEACPLGAIVLSPDFELAVLNADDLEETCEYNLATCDSCGRYFATEKEVAYVTTVLSQLSTDTDKACSKGMTHICPECKQKVDATRAVEREDTHGVPAAFTADEALRDVRRSQELTIMAAETEK